HRHPVEADVGGGLEPAGALEDGGELVAVLEDPRGADREHAGDDGDDQEDPDDADHHLVAVTEALQMESSHPPSSSKKSSGCGHAPGPTVRHSRLTRRYGPRLRVGSAASIIP